MNKSEDVKIFVVDDNLAARTMLRKMLESIKGMHVSDEIATGQGAVIMLEEVDPDIVLLETTVAGSLKLVDIVKEMRKIKPTVKIILCTDEFGKDLVMSGIEAGALDFVMKPCRKDLLERSIRQVMEM